MVRDGTPVMRSSGGLQVVLAAGLLLAALVPLLLVGVGGADERFAPTQVPGIGFESKSGSGSSVSVDPLSSERFDVSAVADQQFSPTVDTKVQVVAHLAEEAEVPDRVRRKYDEIHTQDDTRRLSGTLSLSKVHKLSTTRGISAVRIEGTPEIDDQAVSPGVGEIGAAALHRRGTTGKNVTVGVIDRGFRISHPEIADQVEAYRPFSASGTSIHGTAVASVVADTAPDASLHLAAIGSRTTPAEYREAVEWLVESDADVIVDAGSYFGQPGNGTGPISRVAANASREVAFVTSVGNYAHRHWRGTATPETALDWVTFGNDSANHIANGRTISGRVTLGLQWNGSADYDLFLYRDTPAGDWVWEASRTRGTAENLSTRVPRGRYYVAIKPNSSATINRTTTLSLFANRRLEHRTPRSSLTAPATAPGVIAVGAVNGTRVRPFSSRGPTVDGRRGVDLVAPDEVRAVGIEVDAGTSFAAPYVAGSIALVTSDHPGISGSRAGEIVTVTAVDIRTEGADPASGYGRIDVAAATERAEVVPDRDVPESDDENRPDPEPG